MNNPIKCRAWDVEWENNDKKQGRMIQWEMIRDDFASVQDETSYFIIMQFTGVLDKNGKEIYQGDVVRSFNDGNDAWRGAETFEIISNHIHGIQCLWIVGEDI